MLFLLSPAKSLDYDTATPDAVAALATQPQFLPQSKALIKLLKTQTKAEVAELMDSALLVTRQADARTEPTPIDSVTFTAASVSLMVTATSDEDDDRLTIDGWVTVPGALIEVVTTEETRSEVADANGRFVLDDVPHGPVHFVILTDPEDPAVRPVITPTIQV